MNHFHQDFHQTATRRNSLRILQVSTADRAGGAEAVAWNLFQRYRKEGHHSRLLVGTKKTDDPDVVAFNHNSCRSRWTRFWTRTEQFLSSLPGNMRGRKKLEDLCLLIGQPRRWWDIQRGNEDFDFPETRRVLRENTQTADLVHLHNLHGGYFDLRVLPELCRDVPVILTQHDAWLLSGHCAHSFECERWKTGCGDCPDLAIPPRIKRDATAFNWHRKREIFAASQLYVATPSQWLMNKVQESILAPAIRESKVIPYGVDLDVFQPGKKTRIRRELGFPEETRMLLFAANGIRTNPWKDFATLKNALHRLGECFFESPLVLIALGEEAPSEDWNGITIHSVPHQTAPADVARYYQAADLYVHAAKADTFPNTVLEALACGTPVVATAIGGIVEQVKSLRGIVSFDTDWKTHSPAEATGVLVPPGDAKCLADVLHRLLGAKCSGTLAALSQNASADARRRFDLQRQAADYLSWYREILNRRESFDSKQHSRVASPTFVSV